MSNTVKQNQQIIQDTINLLRNSEEALNELDFMGWDKEDVFQGLISMEETLFPSKLEAIREKVKSFVERKNFYGIEYLVEALADHNF